MLLQVLRLQPLQKQHPEIEEPMGQEAIFLRGECLLQRASRESDLHAGRARPVGCAHGGAGPPRAWAPRTPHQPEAGSARRGTLAQTVGPFTRPPCFPFGLPVSAP